MTYKKVLYSLFILYFCTCLIGCNNIHKVSSGGKGKQIYENKKLGITFDIPSAWNKNYDVISYEQKKYGKKIIFKKKDKKYNIILLEIWVLNQEQWNEWNQVRELKLIGKRDQYIFAYSRPRLKSILENVGEDVKVVKGEKFKELKSMYISDENIIKAIKIK